MPQCFSFHTEVLCSTAIGIDVRKMEKAWRNDSVCQFVRLLRAIVLARNSLGIGEPSLFKPFITAAIFARISQEINAVRCNTN